MSILDIKNLIVLSDRLATAGQPSEAQLRALAGEGYALVINLGLMDPRYCLDDEAGTVRAAGMSYCHIPVEFAAPKMAQLDTFFAAMDSNADRKVFVHCAANYRVTCFVALYGRHHWNWSAAQGAEFIGAVWQPDDVWQAFIDAAAPLPLASAA